MKSITFYTRQGCPLCDEALAAIHPMASRAGVPIEVIDIDLDLGLLDRFNERVPVVEVAGVVITEGIVDLSAVEHALG